MGKVFVVGAATAVGMALISCSERAALYSPANSRMLYEPSAPIERAPLAPPAGYASAASNAPTPPTLHGRFPNEGAQSMATAPGGWRSSPRWGVVKGQGCIVVDEDTQARLSSAETAKAKAKVETCSKEELDAGHRLSAFQSNSHEPIPSPDPQEPKSPSQSSESSPSTPDAPPIPPSENRSDGSIEPWTGAI